VGAPPNVLPGALARSSLPTARSFELDLRVNAPYCIVGSATADLKSGDHPVTGPLGPRIALTRATFEV
jgi:hypothetical protein